MLALQFVQNKIRYVSLSFGSNAYHPHHPDEVLQNRYGDCKDKSLLLLSLLRAAGIQAWPALVFLKSVMSKVGEMLSEAGSVAVGLQGVKPL